jgi:hypothetical protein
MAEIKFEIVEEIGILSEKESGWRKEVNLVKWNDKDPKYDIREWESKHEKMSKGITLTEEEFLKLKEIIK